MPAHGILLPTSCLGLCSNSAVLSWHGFMSTLPEQLRDKQNYWQSQALLSLNGLCTTTELGSNGYWESGVIKQLWGRSLVLRLM